MHYDIPNVGTLRSKVISSLTMFFCKFISKLTITYVFGSKKGGSPCIKYTCIDEETWQKFIQTQKSKRWEVNITGLNPNIVFNTCITKY